MRAIQLNEYGSVDNYELVDVPEPVAGPGQIRIKSDYAGVRWGDIMQRHGTLVRPTPPPFIAGLEAAGRIDQVGEGVTDFQVGDRVVSLVNEGGYAEYVVGSAFTTTKVPDSVPLEEALAYILNLRVAYMLVYPWAKVREGETVLLHAAAGGVGLLTLQILKRDFKNVRVIGICSSEEKADLLHANGCDHVVNRTTQNYVDEVNRICGPKAAGFSLVGRNGGGVDVSFNGVAGPTVESDMQVIRQRGRWLLYGRQADNRAPMLDLQAINYDGITVMPFSINAWFGEPEWAESAAFMQQWLENEELLGVTVWALEQAAEAELAVESGTSVGKTVLAIAQSE
jgi:NADPH2:quinone reductase